MQSEISSLFLLWMGLVGAALAAPQKELDPLAWRLLPQAQVHAVGLYLNEVADNPSAPLPHIRLAPAPVVGQTTLLTRAQITELVRQNAPDLVTTNWCGAAQVRITRRLRLLEEQETRELLVAALQRGFVKDRGELELRFGRPWVATAIADEPFTVNILELPAAGVTSSFIVRFELRAGQALLGNWQVPVQARIWREVWVAGSP
jgi:hypothetical protein